MIEELGMAGLFKKHPMWSSKVTIIGIDGGKENSTDHANSDDDSDAESSDEVEEAEEILQSQDSLKKTYALMKQSQYLMTLKLFLQMN